MSLKQNGRLMNQLPLRFRGGVILSFEYQETNKSQLRNIFASEAAIDPINGVASGHLPPSTWLIAQKSGGISSFVGIIGVGDFLASGALGVNLESDLDGQGGLTATGGLIVSGFSTIAGTSSLTASIVAALESSGNITAAGTITGALSAPGFGFAIVTGIGVLTGGTFAAGSMSAEITLSTELSPTNLSEAVWNYLKTNPTISGSMKEELQKAKNAAENAFAVSS